MDVPLRWYFWLGPILLSCATGCGLLDQETDRRVQEEFADQSSVIPRGQIPGGPIAPPALEALPREAEQANVVVKPTMTPPVSVAPTGATLAPQAVPGLPGSIDLEQAQTQIKIIATIGPDAFVTDDEVSMMVRQRAREFVTLTGSDRDDKEKEIYREELRRLIERELVLADFLGRIRKNKPEVIPDLWNEASLMADRQIGELRRNNGLDDEVKFTEALKSLGLNLNVYRRHVQRMAMTNIYLGQMLKDRGQGIGLAQLQEYYQSHRDEYQVEDSVVWQHLFISASQFKTNDEAKQYAEWLLKSIQGGADVAELAKKYGHGTSALRGGEGAGNKRGEIRPAELEPAVFSLQAGQVGQLVPSNTGYNIIKVQERTIAGHKPFSVEVQKEIRQKLNEMMLKQEREKLITDLVRRIPVSIVQQQ